jgi:hypothetical protein
MQPITYYLDNDVTKRFCQDFGSHWEKLDSPQKFHLISCLASWCAESTGTVDSGNSRLRAKSMASLIENLADPEMEIDTVLLACVEFNLGQIALLISSISSSIPA